MTQCMVEALTLGHISKPCKDLTLQVEINPCIQNMHYYSAAEAYLPSENEPEAVSVLPLYDIHCTEPMNWQSVDSSTRVR